ncbi:GMC family oxidoreductase N-terminal domain-containing protein [Micromonospora sp. WMMD812]|uniref:GMC family oxidoreductase n=1 Tax=Micromonospora sp. WMMD812 TaxID=3015152 RepID=UPI00248CD477|nr:GMC family oxidoreductase N-terminal domain-containing protein [Micromonospora sp. WMMD812]WBB69041.1 GMC family oxidoreductase N-terminal domain-containing protein [Micromonospora sp. WMMD812]
MRSHDTTDFVVIGAGTAGSVVARRLVDAGYRVVVIEAGPSDTREEIGDPLRGAALFGGEVDWGFGTEPQPHAGGRVLYQPRGKTLGGSSVLNGMLYVRGSRADYDAWGDGWAWSDVEPRFRRLEAHHGGPVHIQRNTDPDPLVRAFVDAAVGAGHPFNHDYNAGDSRGASFTQHTIKDGRRVTAWRAYVGPVRESPLLRVVTDALVSRILIEGNRAVGVEYLAGGERHVIRVEREVVLSAGTFGTPQILLLSGLGPADHLRGHGIPVVADLPGVGQNLRDHVGSPVVWESNRAVPMPHVNGIEAQIIADGGVGAAGNPDRQAVFISAVYSTIQENLPEQGFTALALLLHPHSRGRVGLRSANPADAPVIDLGLLSDPRDLEALVEHIESLRAVAEQPALHDWIKAEVYPGTSALRDYVRRAVDSGHHQVGTARIGTDQMAVVDPALRVHGIAGLRVADASVMPTLPAGNTAGPTLMIGERAADLIG